MDSVGLVHPGAMGAAIGAQLVSAGVRTLWAADGRGAATRRRAEEAGLTACSDLAELAACPVVISICPPAAALDVAAAIAETTFGGIYLDANAISPRHALDIERLFGERGGVTVVDGGVVGPPPRKPGTTRLYLSGPDAPAARLGELFTGTALRPIVLDGPVGRASALKLSFATYNKISSALAAQAYAFADHHGVYGELRELAQEALPGTPLGNPDGLVSAGQRAWRWEGEMAEIGAACTDASLPDALLRAAEALFGDWKQYKDGEGLTVAQLLAALHRR
jgi:3-hydroxyisobutyrate dehydrogenase-like beta-hydroxyacid dehydrogenase